MTLVVGNNFDTTATLNTNAGITRFKICQWTMGLSQEVHTLFPSLCANVILYTEGHNHGHVPIPITVPYSLFFELPCAEAAGHKHIRARKAKRRREREVAMRRDLARDGRR